MLHWRFGVLCVDLWLGRINATRVSKNCRLLFFFLSHSCSCLSPSSICFLLNCFVLFCAISYDFSSTLMACLPCSFSSNNSIDFWWLSTFWRWGDEIFIPFLPFSLANHLLLPLCFFYFYSDFFLPSISFSSSSGFRWTRNGRTIIAENGRVVYPVCDCVDGEERTDDWTRYVICLDGGEKKKKQVRLVRRQSEWFCWILIWSTKKKKSQTQPHLFCPFGWFLTRRSNFFWD